MADKNEQYKILLQKMEALLQKQESFNEEIKLLKDELSKLKAENFSGTEENSNVESVVENQVEPEEAVAAVEESVSAEDVNPSVQKPLSQKTSNQKPSGQKTEDATLVKPPVKKRSFEKARNVNKTSLEKFIGENLINKIGILITIIGVALGAKYSIDNNLLGPELRIILGYATGLGLLISGMLVRKNYSAFSAVLVSGAMAIFYFITYAAFDFYQLIPQAVAFALMLLFTAFTVFSAIQYDRQIIAHIGLVGAYAIPFILSQDSGRVNFLFTYMAIINAGILIIAFIKYWRWLNYIAFFFTWVIFLSWFGSELGEPGHQRTAWIFGTLFFALFYITFLAYKFIRKEKIDTGLAILLIINAFIFYGIGYTLIDQNASGSNYLGLFTLLNALIHLLIGLAVYFQKLVDKRLFYLLSILALAFATIAIPVQLDGSWVTLLWMAEAAILFWIGRRQNIKLFESISYVLIIIGISSLIHDWVKVYLDHPFDMERIKVPSLLNTAFLGTGFSILVLAFINYYHHKKAYVVDKASLYFIPSMLSVALVMCLIIVGYFGGILEVGNFWENKYQASGLMLEDNKGLNNLEYFKDYRQFGVVWMVNYSLIFASLLTLLNLVVFKSRQIGIVNVIVHIFVSLFFLCIGLFIISELRESYLGEALSNVFKVGPYHIGIRYISIGIFTASLLILWRLLKSKFYENRFEIVPGILLHTAILWVLSSELLHWLDFADTQNMYKLGLSILWGCYSLFIIVLGIWKRKTYLRVFGIVIFTITLIKLFVYDIAHLNTLSKTVVFVALGILLLIISFLYNKYKSVLYDER